MVKINALAASAALLPLAAAWPTAMEMDSLAKRQGTGRLNTGGGHPNPSFNAKAQYVDITSGSGHEFRSPTSTDLRGECPGLNAASNHGFLPRNGIATMQQTADGLGAAYNMSPELALGLAAIAILISGDILSGTWSIGGAYKSSLPGVLSNPQGILGTHSKYEGDASIVRGDAFLNNNNPAIFQMRSWNQLIEIMGDDLTLDKAVQHNAKITDYSVQNNPQYFSGPFSGFVTPAAHNFVVNFMSNHSADNPGGSLSPDILKTFFAVTGDSPDTYQHQIGQERIPENWFKRPGGADAYNLADVFIDILAGAQTEPGTVRIGGNTGTTNSFTGLDLGDLTGGVFDADTLLQGNNAACFAFRAAQAGSIDELSGLQATLGSALSPLTSAITNAIGGLNCPEMTTYDQTLLHQYPGANQG